jgi:D-tyrosyl-tRNA(Tyr) deacylase
MRAVIQRVSKASVTVDGQVVGKIGRGLLILLGIGAGDNQADLAILADKLVNLRIFPDEGGRFDRSVLDIGGEVLVVSQFTLYADTRRGRRPSFSDAAPPEIAAPLVEAFAAALRDRGLTVASGVFGAHMYVDLQNDGPVTVVLDSATLREPRSTR